MNKKEEIIEMLEVLRDCGGSITKCDMKSVTGEWITVLKDIRYSSFEFVINEAIEYIKGMDIK